MKVTELVVVVNGEGNALLHARTHETDFVVAVQSLEQYEDEARAQELDPIRSWCLGTLYNKYAKDEADVYVEEAERQDGVEYWLRFIDSDGRYDRNALIDDMEEFLEAINET